MNNTTQNTTDLTARLRWGWKRIATSTKYRDTPATVLWFAMHALRLACAKESVPGLPAVVITV